MPISDQQRRRIQEQAGLTDAQVEEAIGTFSVHEESARASGLSREDSEAVRREVRQVGADAALIAAKHNKIAQRTARNPLSEVSQQEIDAERAHLESILADQNNFINTLGNIAGQKPTMAALLNGSILYNPYGGGGLEATEGSLQIHGDTAVLISAFRMRGQGQARRTRSGEIYEQNLDGTYRTTHTFVRRDGRWQYTASQMTQIPEEMDFVFVADEEDYQ